MISMITSNTSMITGMNTSMNTSMIIPNTAKPEGTSVFPFFLNCHPPMYVWFSFVEVTLYLSF